MKCFRVKINFLLLSFLLLTSCSVMPVEMGDVQQVAVTGVNDNKVSLDVVIPLTNPNNFSFKLTRIELEVFTDGMKLGEIEQLESIKVKANSTKNQKFALSFEMPDLLSGGLTMLRLFSQKSVRIEVKGTIAAKAFITKKKVDIHEVFDVDLAKMNK